MEHYSPRPMTDDSPTTMREFEMIAQLRREVGLFDGAAAMPPKMAWDEAIKRVIRLRQLHANVRDAVQEAER